VAESFIGERGEQVQGTPVRPTGSEGSVRRLIGEIESAGFQAPVEAEVRAKAQGYTREPSGHFSDSRVAALAVCDVLEQSFPRRI
jgi:hypothetical protein